MKLILRTVIIAGIPAPTQIIITGPNAILGKLFNTTKNGSDTFDINGDHHKIIAIINPNITPIENPSNVSIIVIFKCSNKLFDVKFKNVFSIHYYIFIRKLYIYPLYARIALRAI